MARIKQINNPGIISGNGKCDRCGDSLHNQKYLLVHVYRPKDDYGNREDRYEKFCHQCSSGDKTWQKHLQEEEERGKRWLQQVHDDKLRAIALINNCSRVTFDTDENGDTIITVIS